MKLLRHLYSIYNYKIIKMSNNFLTLLCIISITSCKAQDNTPRDYNTQVTITNISYGEPVVYYNDSIRAMDKYRVDVKNGTAPSLDNCKKITFAKISAKNAFEGCESGYYEEFVYFSKERNVMYQILIGRDLRRNEISYMDTLIQYRIQHINMRMPSQKKK